MKGLLVVGSFASWQHLWAYQDGYWFMTMWTHSAFIVMVPAALSPRQGCWYHDNISHSVTVSWHWTNQFLSYYINVKCTAGKHQFCKLLIWLYCEWNFRFSCMGGMRCTDSATAPGKTYICKEWGGSTMKLLWVCMVISQYLSWLTLDGART